MTTETVTQMAVAWSRDADPLAAAREAATRAQVMLGGTPDGALIFSAGDEDEALPRVIRKEFGPIPLAGSHAMGLMTPEGVAAHGVGILAFRSEDLVIQTIASTEHGDAWIASARAARLLLAGRPNRRRFPRGLGLLFGDPSLTEQWTAALKGWRDFMGTRIKTIGAITPGPVYQASASYSRALSVFLMEGTVPIGVGVALGFHALEQTFTVTKHDGCRVIELNGAPAASSYLTALNQPSGLDADALRRLSARHPLGLSGGEEHWLIRNVEGIERGSLLLSVELPAGSAVRLMAADPESLKQATCEAVNSALKRLEGRSPEAALMIISASRYELAGAMDLDEREIVQELVGPNTPLLGCISAAEIGPITGTQPVLHTGSLVVAVFG